MRKLEIEELSRAVAGPPGRPCDGAAGLRSLLRALELGKTVPRHENDLIARSS